MKKGLVVSIVGVVSAIICFLSMANYAFPGESAHLQVLWAGLDTELLPSYPLTAMFAKFLGAGNLIAPVCGVLATLLVFTLAEFYVSLYSPRVGNLAGAVAAGVFLLTPAVREASSHLEPRLVDATWALATFALVIPVLKSRSLPAIAASVVMGSMLAIGFCDAPIFVALTPFALIVSIAVARRRGANPVAAAAAIVMSFFVVLYAAMPSFGLGFTPLLKASAKAFRADLAVSGWVFIFFFAIVPFLVALFSCRRAFSEKPGITLISFHLAMSVSAILSVATPLSPSSLTSANGLLPVLICSLVAMLSGYLIAFWWTARSQRIAAACGVVLAFVLVFASVWNFFAFDNQRGAFADAAARQVLADLGPRQWLVTDGTLDDHLLLEARRQNRPLNLISLQRDLDRDYLDSLVKRVRETKIGGSKNEELCISLSLGVLPFVQDWLASDPTVPDQVAIWGAPDLWTAAGHRAIPEFFFFGADARKEPDPSAWRRFSTLLKAPKGWGSYRNDAAETPIDRLRFGLRRHLGLVANNRGVFLEDEKRDDDAFAMYERVLNEIDSDNVCSLFNEVEMAGRGHKDAKAKKPDLERKLKTIIDDSTRRYVIWRLGTFYGYVRNPDMFVRLGFAWARSGRPGEALAQIRRAIDFVPTDRKTALLNMMAALYADENDVRKSKRIYETILAKDANDRSALIGLMRLKLLDGDSVAALEYLERAIRVSPAEGRKAKIELAMVAMMKGDLKRAKESLGQVVDEEPRNLQAWSMLSAVRMQEFDATADKKVRAQIVKDLESHILPEMEKYSDGPYNYHLQTTKAFLLMRKSGDNRRAARDAFEVAARARPDSMVAQDLVLGLDISLDDRTNAERHARDVLRRNRKAPLANYVMGSQAIQQGRYSEAESFLRKAVDTSRPNVLALNDLAEVLRRGKRFEEAEQEIRRAIKIAPEFYILRETLASILMDQGRSLNEAEENLKKAIDLIKNSDKKGESDVRMYVSMARLQEMKGNRKAARASLRKVQLHLGDLTEFERKEYEETLKRVR